MLRSRRFTLADVVSLSRILLAGAFVLTHGALARLALVGVAGATDYLDGWLARRHGGSRYGAVIDPAADRVFVVAVIASLVVEDAMTLRQSLVLLARDIATTLGVLVGALLPVVRPARLESRWSGKVVTALQFATLVAILAEPASLRLMLPMVAVASALSIADYSLAAWRRRAVA